MRAKFICFAEGSVAGGGVVECGDIFRLRRVAVTQSDPLDYL